MPSAALVNAPEIDQPGLAWLNVAHPPGLRQLRGRVVVLDFWTYGCLNCLHALPALRRLERTFPDELTVVGVHSPKFLAERETSNVRAAIHRLDVSHPVVHDPDHRIGQLYAVRAWPTLVVIAPDGKLVGQYRGEPDADKLFDVVAGLIGEWRDKGELAPGSLPVARPEPWEGRLLFPGKLKPLPGTRQRWALADAGHHQIVVLDDAGVEEARFGNGLPGFDDGPAAKASFNSPQGLVCSIDAIFVADTANHAVRRIQISDGRVSTLAGTGRRGKPLGAERVARGTALASPRDLELDGTRLFLANAGTHQLAVLDLMHESVKLLAGNGAEGLRNGAPVQANLAQPSGLAIDDTGERLYFVDSESSAVRALTLDGEATLETIVGAGLFDFGFVDGEAGAARLQHPQGIAWQEGSLVVADSYNNAVRSIDLERGVVSTYGLGFECADDGPLPLREPAGIWAEDSDRILLVDTNNHRVLEYDTVSRVYRTWTA